MICTDGKLGIDMSVEKESVLLCFLSSVGYTDDDVGETGEGFEDWRKRRKEAG